jgi:hypothetical protein
VSQHQIKQDGYADGAECAHGFAHEDLDLNPRQFAEAMKHADVPIREWSDR